MYEFGVCISYNRGRPFARPLGTTEQRHRDEHPELTLRKPAANHHQVPQRRSAR